MDDIAHRRNLAALAEVTRHYRELNDAVQATLRETAPESKRINDAELLDCLLFSKPAVVAAMLETAAAEAVVIRRRAR